MHYTQLKGYTIIQFSWMLLETYNKGSYNIFIIIFNIVYSAVIIYNFQMINVQ